MIIVLKPKCSENDVEKVTGKIKDYGLEPHVSKGDETTIGRTFGSVSSKEIS